MKELTFFHFSDLHIGDTLAKPIWSKIKDELLIDIKYIATCLKHIDVVFVTGDLVQKGSKEEFSEFSAFLKEILDVFHEVTDSSPYIYYVPGNHDLQRLMDTSDAAHQALKYWEGNKDLREKLFWDSNSQYLAYCRDRFANYQEYVEQNNNIPSDSLVKGCLPGDYYSCLEINGVKLGVIGLNSSFLQIEGGDYKGRLGIYLKQIDQLFPKGYVDEIKGNDLNILLTHHASEWYTKESNSEYQDEIYLNYITEHFCGHNHEPQSVTYNTNYTNERRVNIAPSLCGLEKFEDKTDRIHGYQAGKYQIDEAGKIKKIIYPRLAYKSAGGYQINNDNSYKYEKGKDYIEVDLKLQSDSEKLSSSSLLFETGKKPRDYFHPSVIKDSGFYSEVRIDEQVRAAELLTKNRCLWITSHYWYGEEQFLSSVIKKIGMSVDSIFALDCEEVDNIEILDKQIREHFSVPLSNLVTELSKFVQTPVLVFKNLKEELVENDLAQIKTTVSSLLRFNNQIHFVFISNNRPEQNYFQSIDLQPLKLEEVKRYVDKAVPQEDFSAFDIEKIFNLSNGYPVCLDIILKKLEMVELDDLNDADFSFYGSDLVIPSVTKEYIDSIKSSSIASERNCYRLLLLLSLMPKGEMFNTVKRFYSTSPFRLEELNILNDKELLTVEHYYVLKDHELVNQTKVLKVPKIYRDYVMSIEDKDTIRSVYAQICELYLGANWYKMEISLKKYDKDEYYPFMHYNIEAGLKYLLRNSIVNNDEDECVRYLTIAGNYVNLLERGDWYYVGLYVANDLYQLIQTIHFNKAKRPLSFFRYKLANLERMNGHHEQCVNLFKKVIEDKMIDKHSLQSCRECLAYTYSHQNDTVQSNFYADEMLANEQDKKYAPKAIVAKYIKADNNPDESEKLKTLKSLYRIANKKKLNDLITSNIALSISEYDFSKETIRMLDCELLRNSSRYQWMRLMVRKYSLYAKPELNVTLGPNDVASVLMVYSHAFVQMQQIVLTDSHKILWEYYKQNQNYEMMVKILRYSCFVWEMNNRPERIAYYMEQLKDDKAFMLWCNDHLSNEDVVSLIKDRGLYN